MDTAVGMFVTHDAIGPGEFARMVEERGHQGVYFPEHTHIPAAGASLYPNDAQMPRRYSHTYDLLVSMTAAVAATTRVRIGSGICLITERDPIITAKAIASIDHLSGGRVDFGVGAGWNREEMANHGTDPRTRMELMRERILAMREIWSQDEATFHGQHVNFDAIWSWPKPVQRPHPPILVGGEGPTVEDRVIAYGDAWMPAGRIDPDGILRRIPELRRRAADAGKENLPVYLVAAPDDAATLERWRDAGVTRAIRMVPSAHRGRVEADLEKFEAAFAELNGE